MSRETEGGRERGRDSWEIVEVFLDGPIHGCAVFVWVD